MTKFFISLFSPVTCFQLPLTQTFLDFLWRVELSGVDCILSCIFLFSLTRTPDIRLSHHPPPRRDGSLFTRVPAAFRLFYNLSQPGQIGVVPLRIYSCVKGSQEFTLNWTSLLVSLVSGSLINCTVVYPSASDAVVITKFWSSFFDGVTVVVLQ